MNPISSKRDAARKIVYYAGTGAGIGMFFGKFLCDELVWGCAIGAAAGLVIGAAIDAQGRSKADIND